MFSSIFRKAVVSMIMATLIVMPVNAYADSFGFGISTDKHGRATIVFGFDIEPQKKRYTRDHNQGYRYREKRRDSIRHDHKRSHASATQYALFSKTRYHDGQTNIVRLNNGTSADVNFALSRCRRAGSNCVIVYANNRHEAARMLKKHFR